MPRKSKPPQSKTPSKRLVIERAQTGVRMEKRILKVLKGLAEYHDITLGDLLEGVVLHAFEGKTPFSKDSLSRIKDLKRVYNRARQESITKELLDIIGGAEAVS